MYQNQINQLLDQKIPKENTIYDAIPCTRGGQNK